MYRRLIVTIILFAVVFSLAPARVARSATLVVTSTADSGPSTLRNAIAMANPGDIVTFDPRIFNVPRTIILTGDTLTLNNNLTIQGPGPNLLSIDGNKSFRVFTVNFGYTATISGLTIQNGTPTTSVSSVAGGLFNNGILTLENMVFSGNTGAQNGGAIFNGGTLTVNGSSFANNLANNGGGVYNNGALTINNSTFTNNSSRGVAGGPGGAIYNDNFGTLTITSSRFSGNSARAYGGAILNNYRLTVSSSGFTSNVADNNGGGAFTTTLAAQPRLQLGRVCKLKEARKRQQISSK